jgi:hypothetical protein
MFPFSWKYMKSITYIIIKSKNGENALWDYISTFIQLLIYSFTPPEARSLALSLSLSLSFSFSGVLEFALSTSHLLGRHPAVPPAQKFFFLKIY